MPVTTVSAAHPADRLGLRGIAGFGRHGVYEAERTRGQRFVVDVDLGLDLAPAAASDDLGQTVDYAVLVEQIVTDIERDPLNLIEALAGRIAERCLAHPWVEVVSVTVHKPEAEMLTPISDVAVTLTRSRPT